jgi:hypothetical protein
MKSFTLTYDEKSGDDILNGEKVEIHSRDSDSDCKRWSVESLENPKRAVIGTLGRERAIEEYVKQFPRA